MANLNDIKKKIVGVKKTQQITKAMQLVAASKMHSFQKKAIHTRRYAWDLLHLLKHHLGTTESSLFLQRRASGKTLYILYTSDKGLCGSLNGQLMRALFSSGKWTGVSAADRVLVTIGKKAYAYCSYNEIPVAKHFVGLPERLTPYDALELISELLERWVKGDIKEVVMAAPHYKNSFTFYPIVKTFLPFSFDMVKQHVGVEELREGKEVELKMDKNEFMLYEPSEERLMEVMVEQVIQTLFLQGFYELKAAEYSSRMIAMKNATDNAGTIIKQKTLEFNKARQAAITQQLAELSGGMVEA